MTFRCKYYPFTVRSYFIYIFHFSLVVVSLPAHFWHMVYTHTVTLRRRQFENVIQETDNIAAEEEDKEIV